MSLSNKLRLSAIIVAFVLYTIFVYRHDFFGVMWTLALYIVINLIISLTLKDDNNRD